MITIRLHAVESRDLDIVIDDDRLIPQETETMRKLRQSMGEPTPHFPPLKITCTIGRDEMQKLREQLASLGGTEVSPESTWIRK